MEIIIPPELIPSLKDKHLLLDTNIFLDAFSKPLAFGSFFNTLKKNNVTLVTIDLVKFELLKGSATSTKYKEREKAIAEIIDAVLPTSSRICDLVYELIQVYGIDGSAVHITDLFLGANLNQYKKNIYLLTKDTTDFIQRVFNLSFVLNLPHNKGINTYGIYTSK